ncbi:MAG: hypothetical protein K2Q33_01400 [Gammaproteobacteria bacterium]|nr:hypothetical protein [Gammaproteobacteria bacterium]
MKIIHLKQRHAVARFLSEKPESLMSMELVLESQLQIAEYLRKLKPNTPVFLESSPLDHPNKEFITKLVRDHFPNGLPETVSALSEPQKSLLYQNGAADILYYQGLLKDVYQTTTVEYALEVETRVRAGDMSHVIGPREEMAMTFIQALRVARPEVEEVILVFGRAHNFTELCQQYGFKYEAIDTLFILPSKPGEEKRYRILGAVYFQITFCDDNSKPGCYWLRLVDTSQDDLVNPKLKDNYYIAGPDKIQDIIQYINAGEAFKLLTYVKSLKRYSDVNVAHIPSITTTALPSDPKFVNVIENTAEPKPPRDERAKRKELVKMQKIVEDLLIVETGLSGNSKYQKILISYQKKITGWLQEKVGELSLSAEDMRHLQNDIRQLESVPLCGLQDLTVAYNPFAASSIFFNSVGIDVLDIKSYIYIL